MVTVNESAYKSVKKTLTMKIMSIRARHVRARHNKHVHEIYMSYNHIFSIGYIKTDQNIHYTHTITYKHDFHSKRLKRNEKRDYYEKAQKTGGGYCSTL